VPILLQKSKVVSVRVFGEFFECNATDDSYNLSRAAEIACEFSVRRWSPSDPYEKNAPVALRILTTFTKRLLQQNLPKAEVTDGYPLTFWLPKSQYSSVEGCSMLPVTKYAQSGDVFIAYQISGHGPIDIVFAPGFISHLELMWDEPRHAKFLHGLEAFARLIRFDKRGTGLSDRSVGFPPSMSESTISVPLWRPPVRAARC
jgi:hypothetical protein